MRPGRIDWRAADIVKCVVLARMGRGRRLIASRTSLTPWQLSHRLSVLHRWYGLPLGTGFITQWRDGTDPLAERAERIFGRLIATEAKHELPKLDQSRRLKTGSA